MSKGNCASVAIVDDDLAVRESLRFLLETAGYPATVYGSASQFLAEADWAVLCCVLLDQHMPAVTGIELLGELRRRGIEVPVAIVTGSPSAELRRSAAAFGICTVMEKPLADDRLLCFVSASCARPDGPVC